MLLQDILIMSCLKSVAFLGDAKQAFLQIGINKEDLGAFRLHWVKDLKKMKIITIYQTIFWTWTHSIDCKWYIDGALVGM